MVHTPDHLLVYPFLKLIYFLDLVASFLAKIASFFKTVSDLEFSDSVYCSGTYIPVNFSAIKT